MDKIITNNKVIEVLDYLFQKFGIAVDWTSENIMPYIQVLCEKYIRWEISSSIAWVVIGSVLFLIGVALIIWDACNYFDLIGPTVIGFGIIIAAVGILCVNVFDIIRCNVFPELQLIEYVQTLIGNQ